MSAYDTVDRLDHADVTVKVYCEKPMASSDAVLLQVSGGIVFLNDTDAVQLATALLDAAKRARHAARVDAVVAGRTA